MLINNCLTSFSSYLKSGFVSSAFFLTSSENFAYLSWSGFFRVIVIKDWNASCASSLSSRFLSNQGCSSLSLLWNDPKEIFTCFYVERVLTSIANSKIFSSLSLCYPINFISISLEPKLHDHYFSKLF